jgi:hypothetical protein
MSLKGQSLPNLDVRDESVDPPIADMRRKTWHGRKGRVEDERGRWGDVASLRFSSSLIEPDVPISGIRLSD